VRGAHVPRAAGPRRGGAPGPRDRWDYASVAVGEGQTLDAKLGLLVDPLSVFMTLVITGVSTLIHLYSVAYMSGDRGYSRYFAYLNFFVFSMLVLILAGNFLLLIVGWAFVGAASYLLISYWYRRDTATSAGIKAFVINVLGDVGLVLGTFFIFMGTGTLDYLGTFERVGEIQQAELTAGCLLPARRRRSRSPRRSRCTPGWPTRWRARPRSPR
jgi:NADH-quinone oxidoreductase subunit L